MRDLLEAAQGRLRLGRPVAIIDIGSNSVRLVVYEALSRAPTPIFNEKVLCGLGKNVASSGRLNEEAVMRAISALKRFRLLCDSMGVGLLKVLATAAARDAKNGPQFLMAAEEACGVPIELLSGDREAYLSALGIQSGFYHPDGVAGDLGGGSLELIEVRGTVIGPGVSVRLGGLALQDRSRGDIKLAEKIVKEELAGLGPLEAMRNKTFYAVGGTWRSLARLHMRHKGYPLNVMHGYSMPASDVAQFAQMVERADLDALDSIDAVSSGRRPLLSYGALVLEQLIRRGKPKQIVISASGVREGVLYEMLPPDVKSADPLLAAAEDLNVLRSRSPSHGHELASWTDALMHGHGFSETEEERRLRYAACLLADIGWRAHPDYRGEQSLNIIAHAAFVGIDHPGRAFLALAVCFRHSGPSDDQVSPRIRELVSSRMLERARVLGTAMRVAYLISASMPGLLPRVPLVCDAKHIKLHVPKDLEPIANERVKSRLRQLGKLMGRDTKIVVERG